MNDPTFLTSLFHFPDLSLLTIHYGSLNKPVPTSWFSSLHVYLTFNSVVLSQECSRLRVTVLYLKLLSRLHQQEGKLYNLRLLHLIQCLYCPTST